MTLKTVSSKSEKRLPDTDGDAWTQRILALDPGSGGQGRRGKVGPVGKWLLHLTRQGGLSENDLSTAAAVGQMLRKKKAHLPVRYRNLWNLSSFRAAELVLELFLGLRISYADQCRAIFKVLSAKALVKFTRSLCVSDPEYFQEYTAGEQSLFLVHYRKSDALQLVSLAREEVATLSRSMPHRSEAKTFPDESRALWSVFAGLMEPQEIAAAEIAVPDGFVDWFLEHLSGISVSESDCEWDPLGSFFFVVPDAWEEATGQKMPYPCCMFWYEEVSDYFACVRLNRLAAQTRLILFRKEIRWKQERGQEIKISDLAIPVVDTLF